MIKPNRKIAPPVRSIDRIDFPSVESYRLENGILVHSMNSNEEDIIKLDILLNAGQWYSSNRLVPVYCNRMLMEESTNRSHSEIAEKLDYLGIFVNLECGKHYAQIQLFTLSQFFEQGLEILEDFIKFPTFPQNKLKILIQNDLQQFIVSREKTEVLAADVFIPEIFGKDHPYGYVRKTEDFEFIEPDQIKDFHQRFYNSSNCTIMVSGKLTISVNELLQKHFGMIDWLGNEAIPEIYPFNGSGVGKHKVHKDGAQQASLMIGKRIINKTHPDYNGLSILNTVLGGYFGSRLMSNLREKNALTYGIYSSLMSMLHAGTFTISANVNAKEMDKAIRQIHHEIEILKEKLIPDAELSMVKNYIAGEMLRTFDGPLGLSEIYLDLLAYQLDFSFYEHFFETLKSTTAKKLRDLANIYLDKDSFIEVIAGDLDKK